MQVIAGQECFVLWPIALAVRGGFVAADGAWTVKHLAGLWEDPTVLEALTNSLCVAAATTTLALVITLPLALIATRYTYPGKAVLTALLMMPLILPPFVGAIGFKALLGRFGAINSGLIAVGVQDVGAPGMDFLGAEIVGGRFWAVAVCQALHL